MANNLSLHFSDSLDLLLCIILLSSLTVSSTHTHIRIYLFLLFSSLMLSSLSLHRFSSLLYLIVSLSISHRLSSSSSSSLSLHEHEAWLEEDNSDGGQQLRSTPYSDGSFAVSSLALSLRCYVSGFIASSRPMIQI
ncbi:hypothetical protein Bca4012_019931 [Brassica carinata]